MVPALLVAGIVALFVAGILAFKEKNIWIGIFALVAGLLLANTVPAQWALARLNEFVNWIVGLFH